MRFANWGGWGVRPLLGCCFFPGDVFAPVCGSFLGAEQERQVSFQGSSDLSLALISIRVAPSLTFLSCLWLTLLSSQRRNKYRRNGTKQRCVGSRLGTSSE